MCKNKDKAEIRFLEMFKEKLIYAKKYVKKRRKLVHLNEKCGILNHR